MQTARCFSPAGGRFSLYFGCSSSRIKASTPAARQEFSALQVLPVDLHQCPRNPSNDDAGALRKRHNCARSEDTNLAAMGHSITYCELGAGGAGPPATEPGRPLPPALLYRPCDPAELPFDLVGELEDLAGADRPGSCGRSGRVRRRDAAQGVQRLCSRRRRHRQAHRRPDLLNRRAESVPTPPDWCYVNNFADPQKPRRLQLPPGRGNGLREAMKRLVEELRAALPAAFERDDYRARRDVIDQQFKQRNEQGFGELQRRGEQKGISMLRTPMGLALAPRRDGKVLTPEMFEALPEAERERIQRDLEEVQGELEAVMQKVPQWEREHREAVRELNRNTTGAAIALMMDELRAGYCDLPDVVQHLDAVEQDIKENADDFLTPAQPTSGNADPGSGRGSRRPRRASAATRSMSSSTMAASTALR